MPPKPGRWRGDSKLRKTVLDGARQSDARESDARQSDGSLFFHPAGRAFFGELDSDGDGKVTADDVKRALRERNLPDGRARDLISAARGGRWWSQSIE